MSIVNMVVGNGELHFFSDEMDAHQKAAAIEGMVIPLSSVADYRGAIQRHLFNRAMAREQKIQNQTLESRLNSLTDHVKVLTTSYTTLREERDALALELDDALTHLRNASRPCDCIGPVPVPEPGGTSTRSAAQLAEEAQQLNGFAVGRGLAVPDTYTRD